MLAAADLLPGPQLGRPDSSRGSTARLDGLANLVIGGSQVAAPVLVAVVHGELLALAPFAQSNGVVARAAARLTMVSSGLDPKRLIVPEVAFLRRSDRYAQAAADFTTGTDEGLADWILFCCEAVEAGAREATSIAEAALTG